MDRTSIFHNELFKLDNGHLLGKNPTLPNLTRVDLYNPKIDTLTKKISTDFLLHSIVFPVFHLKKVAFQCLTPQILMIDGRQQPCSRQALTFNKIPMKMPLDNTTIWDNIKNQPSNHLAKQIRWAFSDLKPEYEQNSLFSNNISSQHALDQLTTYFQQIGSIELGFLSTSPILTLTLVVIIPFLLFCFYPKILQTICCCSKQTNKIATAIERRIFTLNERHQALLELQRATPQVNPPSNPQLQRATPQVNPLQIPNK